MLRASVAGWDAPVYIHPDHLELARRAADGDLAPSLTAILSPFDPIVWDNDIAAAVVRCAHWHGCADIALTPAIPHSFAAPLKADLAG